MISPFRRSNRGVLPLQSTSPTSSLGHDEAEVSPMPEQFHGEAQLDRRFEGLGRLGEGGSAVVHRAREHDLGREVAIKVLRPEQARKRQLRERFVQEAQITGQLEHPNIVPVHELGRDDEEQHYFTMKLIRGQTLSAHLRTAQMQGKAEALLDALNIFLKVCDALAYAHSRGVIHCDIKPENIMVGSFGQVYLTDWGIARLMGRDNDLNGRVVGTYNYMAPEQAHGGRVDPRTDIFSMGGVLYYILTGKQPYWDDDEQALLDLARDCATIPPEQRVQPAPPASLSRIAMRALACDPEQRFQDVESLRSEVQRLLHGRWRFPTLELPAGAVVVEEGEPGAEAFMLRSGNCEVYRILHGRKLTLRLLSPGDVFGETAVFSGQSRTASVQAITPVSLWVVQGSDLLDELGVESPISLFVRSMSFLFTEASSKLSQVEEQLANERLLRRAAILIAREGEADERGERWLAVADLQRQLGEVAGLSLAEMAQLLEKSDLFRIEGEGEGRVALA